MENKDKPGDLIDIGQVGEIVSIDPSLIALLDSGALENVPDLVTRRARELLDADLAQRLRVGHRGNARADRVDEAPGSGVVGRRGQLGPHRRRIDAELAGHVRHMARRQALALAHAVRSKLQP